MPSRTLQKAGVPEGKVLALLSYLSILCIIPLLFQKDNDFVLAHGKQGLVLFIGEDGVFVLSILFPWLLKGGLFILSAVSFFGIIAVLRGQEMDLPIVSAVAKRISL